MIDRTPYERPEATVRDIRMESAMLVVSNQDFSEDHSDDGFFDDGE